MIAFAVLKVRILNSFNFAQIFTSFVLDCLELSQIPINMNNPPDGYLAVFSILKCFTR